MSNEPYSWKRFGGYEVSSVGDRRFSAFNARLHDGRSIEEHYQCDVKGYDPGGTNWRLGKGKPPLHHVSSLWSAYLGLWIQWAQANPELMDELMRNCASFGNTLSDRFATTEVNQAHALCWLLNNGYTDGPDP